eukprot:14085993-Alexandrium_andersonii.AAC.1
MPSPGDYRRPGFPDPIEEEPPESAARTPATHRESTFPRNHAKNPTKGVRRRRRSEGSGGT